ncbi:hypothetical protein YC2023_051719 [Brassica napus]
MLGLVMINQRLIWRYLKMYLKPVNLMWSVEYDHDDSHHDFYGVDGDSESSIENMKEEYGLLVWPCSVILADGNTDPDFVVLPFSR